MPAPTTTTREPVHTVRLKTGFVRGRARAQVAVEHHADVADEQPSDRRDLDRRVGDA